MTSDHGKFVSLLLVGSYLCYISNLSSWAVDIFLGPDITGSQKMEKLWVGSADERYGHMTYTVTHPCMVYLPT